MAADFFTVASLLAALLVLAKASEYAIVYASTLARLAGISEMAVGFLLVAVSTSLPELVVSVTSALSGSVQLGIGNVFGANIADATLVIAAAAITAKVTITREEHGQLTRILLAVSALSIVMVLGKLSAALGVALLAVFCGYVYFVLKQRVKFEAGERKGAVKSVQQGIRRIASEIGEFARALLFFSSSMLVIILASRFAVDTAVNFASAAGVGLAVVGATLVSIGTTLPELSVSISAARAGKSGLALGNAIGSCITNISLVLGLAIVINPAAADLAPHLGLIAYSLFVYLLLLFFIDYRRRLGKLEGGALVLAYLVFLLAQANIIPL